MAKQANIRAQGLVVKALPNAHFIVKVLDQEFSGLEIEAHISGKMRLNFIKILPGDLVVVELSPFDLKKGRIVYRGREMKQEGDPNLPKGDANLRITSESTNPTNISSATSP